jgi:hypothetical protein
VRDFKKEVKDILKAWHDSIEIEDAKDGMITK